LPPEFAHVLSAAAEAHLDNGDATMSATIYGEYFHLIGGMASIPAEEVHHLMYAGVAYNHHDPVTALELCQEYLRATGGIESITPENAGGLINIAGIYYRNDLMDLASRAYHKYFELIGGINRIPEKYSQILLLMRNTCIRQNNIDGASEACYYYNRLMNIENTTLDMIPYIGHYYYIAQEYENSLDLYNDYFKNIGGLDKLPASLGWVAREALSARLLMGLEPGVPRKSKQERPISPLATSRALKPSECTTVDRKEPLAPKPPLGSTAGQSS
jgi:hypothetical protein